MRLAFSIGHKMYPHTGLHMLNFNFVSMAINTYHPNLANQLTLAGNFYQTGRSGYFKRVAI